MCAMALGVALAALSGEALAQGRPASSSVELARAAEALKPGEWVWAPEIAPAGPILIYVDLSAQLATIYRNGVRIGVSTVSSGREGHETPTGVFTILQKDADHRSSLYNNAPMFYMERLTWDGVALHAGGLPGYPESHGCIHLPIAFARLLYRETHLSVTVVVAGNAARRIGTPPGGVVTPFESDGDPAASTPIAGEWRWTPELSPEGPVTVILSKSDQTAVVLRNGVEIGRSAIRFDDHDGLVHVLTLADGEGAAAERWIYAGLPGQDGEAGRVLDDTALARLDAPREFRARVQAILKPGDTVLVTPAPVSEGSAGRSLTIMDASGEL
jgi:hypothetical protein